MESLYAKGVRRTFVYYFSGLLLTFLFHLIMEAENKTMMPKSTMVLLFTAMGALPWMMLNIINLASRFTDPQNRGELLVHGAIFFIVMFFITRLS
jgi:hypothetical protein